MMRSLSILRRCLIQTLLAISIVICWTRLIFEALSKGPVIHRQLWIESMDSARVAAEIVRAGRPVLGGMGTFDVEATNPPASSAAQTHTNP